MTRETRDLEPIGRSPEVMAELEFNPEQHDLRASNDLSPEELADQESSELADPEATPDIAGQRQHRSTNQRRD